MLSISVKPNDFFGLVLYQIHKAKIGSKSIRWCDGEMRKDISVPSHYIKKPSLASQWRAITRYPFFHQIMANLLA
jgi:hypothetical protein